MYFRLAIISLVITLAVVALYYHKTYLERPGQPSYAEAREEAPRSGTDVAAPDGTRLTAEAEAAGYNPSDVLIRRRIELLLALLSREAEAVGVAAPVRAADAGMLEDGQRGMQRGHMNVLEELNRVLDTVPSHMDAGELVVLSDRAAEELERAVVESHRKRGIHYFLADDMEAAIKVWDAVLTLDPGNRNAMEYKKRAEAVLEGLKEVREKSSAR